ncbi:hypothetical protein ACQR0Z_07235 [Bradyrhizobium sp. HKCCYLS3077]|uniref:hypothetical protein n=1 Tax=Bradyrhizobium sp. HKCCYLS3077 TaxID=3420761 RepID=UPI003EB8845C
MKLNQRKALLVAGALLAGLVALSVQAETTSIRNGSNSASVTQSGGAATTDKKVETRSGYTRIEQHSGGNSATIVQRSGPVTPPTTEADPGQNSAVPSTPVDPDAMDDDDDRKSASTEPNVYREVRKGASPQSQKTLDKLITSMGLQKKM